MARILEAQAELALAQHGARAMAHASELFGDAIALFQRFVNQSEARRLRDRLQMLRFRRPPRPQLPASLSPREVEALRLVVHGKSNRQIAAELALSERTVENHLTRIYGKVGVENRAAATAFAICHGIE